MVFGLLLCARATFAAGRSTADLAALPLAFEETEGQFVARTSNLAIRVGACGFSAHAPAGRVLSVSFSGANPAVSLVAEEQLPGQSNSMIGNDPRAWRTGRRTWRRIRAAAIYPKIDLVYYGTNRQMEFDLIVNPGGDPSKVKMKFSRGSAARIDEQDDLVIDSGGTTIRQHRPVAFQWIDGARREIAVKFSLRNGVASFALGNYDRAQPLTIDPVLSYATFLGGSNTEAAYAIAVDTSGNTYVAGETYSIDFPKVGPAQNYQGGKDIFVTKLNAAGTAVIYSTYLGGSSNDTARAIAVDSSGQVYITGQTYSPNFPTTGGAYRVNPPGNADAFVTKLNSAGNGLMFSSYIGGTSNEMGTSIAIDGGTNIYVAGYTDSTNFPVTSGVVQSTHRGGFYDGWVVKMASTGSSLVFSTFLGGAGIDVVSALAIDSSSNVYVAGQTDSVDFPVVNAFQASRAGNSDAFVAKLNSSGTVLIYSTYLGGSSADQAFGLGVDGGGSAYVAGSTFSSDYPVTPGVYQTAWQGQYDGFITKLNPTGNGLTYSTFLGGSGNDVITALRVSAVGLAWVAGYTDSTNFPTLGPTQPTNRGSREGFVATLSATGSSLSFATYLGGSVEDVITALVIDSSSNAFVAGYTASPDLPVTAGAYQNVMVRSYDGFVASIRQAAATPPSTVSVSPASGTGLSRTFQFRFSDASGYGNLTAVDMQLNGSLNASFGCLASYNPLNGVVTLTNDAGTGSVGSAAFGSGTTLQNSQCQINAASSTASGSGTTLTVNLALTFKLAFVGGKSTFGRATNSGGLSSGWVLLGTWSVQSVNQPPSVTSIAPYSGAGLTQAFDFGFSDSNGYTDLNTVYVQVSASLNVRPGCSLWYVLSTNTLYLINDAGTDAFGPYILGIPGTAQNSQCAINLASSGITALGNNLTLTIAFTFKNSYLGLKQTYAFAQDNAGLLTGWQRLGTWTVGATNQPPTVTGITPSSGSGTSQVFNFTYSDGNGFADLSTVYGQISPTLHAAPGCSFWYTQSTNVLFLINDAGNNATGPFTVGSAGTAQNGQCSINLGTSSTSTSGNTLVVSLAITFKSGYSGLKGIFSYASDNPGLGSGWQNIGSWTVP